MFTIVIQEKGGDQRRMVFNKSEVTIGRVQGNDVVLPKGNVSKRHARVVLKDSKFIIVDLKSTNGTYVNGRKITSPLVVKSSDKIYIGDFIVGVEEATSAEGDGSSQTTTAPPGGNLLQQLDPDALRASELPPETSLSPMVAPQPQPQPRSVPPRPAPGSSRDPAGPRTRDYGPAPMVPPAGRPSASPPVAPGRAAVSNPPMAAIPPLAPVPARAPSVAPIAHLEPVPAPVVPLPEKPHQNRSAPSGAIKISARPVSATAKRSVHLEPLDAKIVKRLDLQANVVEGLRAKLNLDTIALAQLSDEGLWKKAQRTTIDLVEALEAAGELPKYVDQDGLIKDALDEALGLGPLEDLLADEAVDEILIDRRDRVVIGQGGALRGSGKAFSSDEAFERVVKRLVHEAGSVIDDNTPMVDVRMRGGTRLTAALPPVAARGACLVLKKPSAAMPRLADLVQSNVLSSGMAAFLTTCITARRNILVCGGPGSGKAPVVAALAAAVPAGERVVSVEEVAELAIARDEWIQLEARTGTPTARDIDMAAVLEMALRFGPDRLVVGDVRGREAVGLVHALSSQVDGAIVAMAGDGVISTLHRLALLMRATGVGGSDMAYRELVASAFDVAVHVVRRPDGAMRVQSVEELLGVSEVAYDTKVLFAARDNGFVATGTVPRFYAELEASGLVVDRAVFR